MFEFILTLQLIACAAMTGIIWMVQVAIYPLLARLEGRTFDDYHTRYMNHVTYVIAPFMFLEATTCAACLYLGKWQDFLFPTILLAIAWASTAFIQVPQHTKLTPETVPALVRSNWIRSIAWTTRLFLLAMVFTKV
ncbi:MAG: putative membrane protein [Akkermansiaceae bacterium]|jgi:predicted membrane protein